MSKIEFNASKLKDIIDRSKAEASKRSNNSSSNVSIAFLPEGKHKIRLFFDKAGDLYRTAVTHKGPKGQVLCPDYLAERDTSREYPECEFCKQAEIQDDWKLNRRFNIMTFGQLIHTDSPGDYWEAGNVYCIVGNTKYRKSIDSFLSSLYEDSAEYLMTLFDPQIPGGYLSIDVTKGTQGNIAITVIPGKSADPIATEDWWKPLNEVWISPEFNDEKWKENMDEFMATLPNAEAQPAPAGGEQAASSEGSDSGKPNPEEGKQPTAETPKEPEAKAEPTPAPAATPAPKAEVQLADNQVILKDGRTVDLPEEAIEAKCWKQYDASNPVCIVCSVNADCMMESING